MSCNVNCYFHSRTVVPQRAGQGVLLRVQLPVTKAAQDGQVRRKLWVQLLPSKEDKTTKSAAHVSWQDAVHQRRRHCSQVRVYQEVLLTIRPPPLAAPPSPSRIPRRLWRSRHNSRLLCKYFRAQLFIYFSFLVVVCFLVLADAVTKHQRQGDTCRNVRHSWQPSQAAPVWERPFRQQCAWGSVFCYLKWRKHRQNRHLALYQSHIDRYRYSSNVLAAAI